MLTRLPELLNEFVQEADLDSSKIQITAFRKDGITLCSGQRDSQTHGALMGGAWQAAMALLKLSENTQFQEIEQRFSVDNSNTGVYIVPFTVDNELMFLGTVYTDVFNPGPLKNKLRLFAQRLPTELKQKLEKHEQSTVLRKEFLFENISDKEIDDLFSFSGRI